MPPMMLSSMRMNQTTQIWRIVLTWRSSAIRFLWIAHRMSFSV